MPRQIRPGSCHEVNELATAISGWEVSQPGRLTMNDTNPQTCNARADRPAWNKGKLTGPKPPLRPGHVWLIRAKLCLLYTSDAADERSSVDLGGRRIIK